MSIGMRNDQEARRRIREDLHTNFFVEAGAGSGKTTALVDRMVAMVEGGIDAEKICAITFTVAASREFYDRFQRRLKERLDGPEVTEKAKGYIRTALRDIDLCFMGTIDSFCNLILREHPTRAHVPSTVSIVEEADMQVLYLQEYARLKHGEYSSSLLELYHRFCEVHRDPDRVFRDSIQKFMSAHAAHWVMPDLPGKNWAELLAQPLEQLEKALRTLSEHPACLNTKNKEARAARDALPDVLRVLEESKSGGNFADVLRAIKPLSVKDDPSDMKGLGLTCDPAAIGIAETSLFAEHGSRTRVNCLMLQGEGGLLSQLQEYQYTMTVRFLSTFASHIAGELKKKGQLSFYDTLLYLRDMLREDAAAGGRLTQHIRARHSCFLIDEFQDTDPMQAEVFFRLASEEPTEDWRDARPVPGSLFIVGDPKQSIYRFRGADVNAYLAVKKLFASQIGEVLYLQQNFRSSGTLRMWFNETFSSLLPEETACQSKFDPIPMEEGSRDAGTLYGAWHYQTGVNGNPADVATIIRRIVHNPSILIQTQKDQREGKPPRPIDYRDIMVITKNTRELAAYAAAIKGLKIPCRVEGSTSFTACPAFAAMTDLIVACADPSDSAAVYRVLRGQVFHYSSEEITAWKKEGHRLRLYGHEEEDSPISVALAKLDEFRKQSILLPPAAICHAALEEFQLFRVCGTANMEYVWFAIELLRTATSDHGICSLMDTSDFLDSLMAGDEDVRRVLDLNDELNRVHLANLHKVKGLEAPIVILAQLKQANHAPAQYMEMDGPSQNRWIFSLHGKGKKAVVHATTNRYPDEMSKEKENVTAEEVRLMYVAATRAGCALLIPRVSGGPNLWDMLFASATKDIDAVLYDPSAEEPSSPEEKREQTPDEWRSLAAESPLQNQRVTAETWQLRTPSDLHDSDKEPAVAEKGNVDSALPWGEASSLLLGTAVHRAMELLVSSRAALDDARIISALRDEFALARDEKAEDICSILRNTLKTARNSGWKQETNVPQDILCELLSADEVFCEVPFSVLDGNAVTSGVMDVVYRKGTEWHVVDYKTNANPYGLDHVYVDQMAAYRHAVELLFGTVPSVHTYHIPLLRSGD